MRQTLISQFLPLALESGRNADYTPLPAERSAFSGGGAGGSSSGGWEMGLLPSLPPHQDGSRPIGGNVYALCYGEKST